MSVRPADSPEAPMKRRTFLKGAAVSGAAVGIGFDMSKARAEMRHAAV